MKFSESNAVTAAGAAAGAFAGVRYGGALPDIGPLQGPVLLIVIGGILAAGVNLSGTTGDAVRGFGFGLVATGVVGLAS